MHKYIKKPYTLGIIKFAYLFDILLNYQFLCGIVKFEF